MNRSLRQTVLVGLVLLPFTLVAQVITGTIYDALTKEPLVGIAIQAPGETGGTVTDNKGFFTLQSKARALTVSGVGYKKQEVIIANTILKIGLEPAVEDLQTIVVTGNRESALRTQTPMAIAKLSPRLIDETKPTSAYEIINKTPGVLMVNLGNEQHMMAIRQPMTTNAYFLYLEDGIPIRPMGVFNHNAVLEMNQFTISSVEVVKGPVSSIYGPEAVGGAVNFITQRPTAVPTARIGIQADQWGYHRLQYGAGATLGKVGVYLGGFVSRQRDSWLTSSDYDKTSFNARLEYNFTPKTRLIGTLAYNNYHSQTSGSVDSTAFYSRQYVSTTDFTYRNVYSLRSRLTLEHDWTNGKGQTWITAFVRDNSIGQNPAYSIRWVSGASTASGQVNENAFKSYGVIAQHTQRFALMNAKLIMGITLDQSPNTYRAYQTDLSAQLRADKKSVIKYTQTAERPDLQLANYDATIYNTGSYVQYDFEPLPRLRLSTGLRYDRMAFDYTNALDRATGDKLYSQLTPKLGATYDLGRGKGVYASYSKGFSPPSLTAIFLKRPAPTATGDLFYYNLQPARFHNIELGGWASLLANKVYLDGALYQMNGTNELLNIRQPDNSIDYQSAGKTLHRGVEMGLTYKPSKQVFFRLGGTYAVHRFIDFTLSQRVSDAVRNANGKDMPSAPRYFWNTEISYYPSWLKNARTSLEWQHVAGWYQNQINSVRYGGYNVLNLRGGYQWHGIEVFTNVTNLANALYTTNATRGNNPTDRTTFYPAAPRTVTVGLQYNFAGKQ